MLDTNQIDVFPDEQVGNIVSKINVNVVGSWSTRGWSYRNEIVDVFYDLTGKNFDVIRKCLQYRECNKAKERKAIGEMSNVEFLEWHLKYKPNCLMNHEGSASVCPYCFILITFCVFCTKSKASSQ